MTCIFRRTYTTGMHRESIEQHFLTLKHRYDDRRLQQAAVRRAHLDCQRIHVGDGPGSGRVKFLLAQMHQTYYFGFSESACILSGTLLEQGLIHRLAGCLAARGPLLFQKNGEKRWLQKRPDLRDLELVDALELARAEGILREGRILLLAHEIRWIRNMVVHEKIPLFLDRDERFFELTVAKSRKGRPRVAKILLEKSEVAEIVEGALKRACASELTAYFCVSRTRMVLRNLFNENTREAKASDEGSGSLFLWSES